MKNVVFVYLLLISFRSYSNNECRNEDFQYTQKGISKKISKVACVDQSKKYPLISSKDCFKKACPLIQKINELNKSFKSKEQVGSPHFNVCYAIKGIPMVVEVIEKTKIKKQKRKSKSLSLCFDKQKKSFLDANALMFHFTNRK